MASELTLEQLTWHQLECAANSAGGIEVAMVSLPIAQVKALVEGRNTRPAPIASHADATDEMVDAALAVDWDNEDERATVHNIWHAMTAHLPTPVAPVSPDATGKCGGLETVAYQYWRDQTQEWLPTGFPDRYRKDGFLVRELVTHSQAEELLAAERAEKEKLADDYQAIREQLHRGWRECRDLKADNAALTARVNGFEGLMDSLCEILKSERDIGDVVSALEALNERAEALEAKLAAAEKALGPFAAVLEDYDPDWEDDDVCAVLVVGSVTHYGITLGDFRQARAALGGKPS
ncbi:hypothetical protein [Brucella anthropi]|uniref:hypothetical protein n=1 Tax=Brucella anthropi TaxID=529 RepID=UPI0021654EBE|nr:hypothetical protein [Brucella anthropi]UVV66556.1 hypothetical protein NW321_08670 [Brucella anthropi]